jgi:glycosyltransferase involved in cell wall biosynthesis
MSDDSREAGRPPLSVVLPTRNRPDLLKRCLDSVLDGGRRGDEIIVVDSASNTDDAARVAASYDVRYVRVDLPGVSRARNAGWRAARNELVAFIDDDARAHPGWRDAMALALDEPGNAFVAGWIGLPPEQEGAIDPQPYIVLPDRIRFDANSPRYFAAGANIGVRRSPLATVGGFDERLGAGMFFGAAEEADLFDRLIAVGHCGEYRPDVRVDHDAWRTRRDRRRQQWSYGKATGARLRLLLRRDRARGVRLARRAFWKRGVKLALREARARSWGPAGFAAMHVLAVMVGFLVAWPVFRKPWPLDASEAR